MCSWFTHNVAATARVCWFGVGGARPLISFVDHSRPYICTTASAGFPSHRFPHPSSRNPDLLPRIMSPIPEYIQHPHHSPADLEQYNWLGEMTESFMAEKTKWQTDSRSCKSESEAEDSVEVLQHRRILGDRLRPFGGKTILERRKIRSARREAVHRRNVLGLLPTKDPKPPKKVSKAAVKRDRKMGREVGLALQLFIPYRGFVLVAYT